MKLGIIISGTNAERNWNALRLANFALEKGDAVKIFLMGEGVEYEKTSNNKFNVKEQVSKFLSSEKAVILACGTCLQSRSQESTDTCPISTLKDSYDVIEWSDKLLTF
jgi:uncharacterized protein involved in oxidation of intracellular sulfur